jgi:malonate transporter and related proteins
MDTALLIIPVLAIIVLGWICASVNYVPRALAAPIIQFVFKVATPALIFLVLAQVPVHEVFNWPFIGVFGGASLVFFAIITLLALLARQPLREAAVIGLAGGQSSATFVALPILLVIFGHFAALPVAITVFILLIIMLPIGILLMELGREDRQKSLVKTLMRVILNTLKNPVVLASILGVLYSSFQIPMPHSLETFCHLLAGAVTPCALFAVGLDIQLHSIRRHWLGISLLTISKLICLPAAVLGLSLLFHLTPQFAIPAVLIACVPIAKIVYMLSSEYHIKTEFFAATTAATELASIITMFVWILILAHIWPASFSHLLQSR